MKRSVVALSVLVLALTGCSSDTNQSGGTSNPDSQVEQPPLPGETDDTEQGPDDDSGPDDESSDDPSDDSSDG